MEKDNKKIKILMAEDDKFISRAYKDGLTRAGFDIIMAADGNEAIALVKSELPDIILLDLIMPDKNGFEALEEFKKMPETKDTPVIILSNLGQDTDIKQSKELGAVDYLIKSNYSMPEVIEKIKKHLLK
ncbi:response regulator [Candidatus Parcubacteria bacterium]|nr:response regulator [Candidatus Parcubacteria bacterium]